MSSIWMMESNEKRIKVIDKVLRMKQAVAQLIRGKEEMKNHFEYLYFSFSDDRCQESFNSDQR